jgi:predicted DNA-binding transcriptional regulator AlpA
MDPIRLASASPDDLLLLPEVAEITRRPESTLRWLRHRGEGPRGHRSGRRVYYRRSDVMAWLAEEERRAEDAAERDPQPAA